MKKSRASLAFVLRRYHLKTNRRLRWTIYGLLAVFLFALLVGAVTPQRYNLAAGQVSRVLITAPNDAVDVQATRSARAAAGAVVTARYDIDPAVVGLALAELDRLFHRLDALAQASGRSKDKHTVSAAKALTELRAAAPTSLGTDTLERLLSLSLPQRQSVESDTIRITQRILDTQFSGQDMERAAPIVGQQLVGLNVNGVTRTIIGRLVQSVLRPNLVYDPVATREARLQAERAVPEVWINRGDIIVRPGQVVTPAIIGQLEDLKLLKTQPDYGMIGGFLFFIVLLTLGSATFIQLRKGRVARDNVHLILYAVIVLFVAILIRLARAGVEAGLPADVVYVLPVATASMMIAMFFGTSLAMLSSVFIAFLASAAFGFSFAPFFVSLLSAFAGTMAITRVSHRRVFMRAGFLTAAVNVAAITVLHFLFPAAGANLWHALAFGVVGGLLSSVLTIGIMPYLETAFGVITHMGLLELANPNHPLLRRLLLEAPGTYHHSLIVGNLAEAAAEEIGADPLVCRVGAYYHDVGKTKRPAFFVENQVSGENPHDRIAPHLSHLIITAHVADGLAMLREYNLPEPIRAICAEHHGTTVLWYFYNKAVEESKHQPPDADHYRYPGPRPQSKESAIVMVCDGVEAAVRSMVKPTPQRIEALIRKILKDRLSDGQFDECDITLRDLERMVPAFMRTLKGIYHERIEYPDPVRIGQVQAK